MNNNDDIAINYNDEVIEGNDNGEREDDVDGDDDIEGDDDVTDDNYYDNVNNITLFLFHLTQNTFL